MVIKKKRNTMQKKVILDAIRIIDNHPTVEDVYVEVKKTYATMSKNTVYRNLRVLAADGEIRKVSLRDEIERYENISKKHYHFQCDVCGKIFDVEMDYIEELDDTAKQMFDFDIKEHDITFRGICPECEKKKGEY